MDEPAPTDEPAAAAEQAQSCPVVYVNNDAGAASGPDTAVPGEFISVQVDYGYSITVEGGTVEYCSGTPYFGEYIVWMDADATELRITVHDLNGVKLNVTVQGYADQVITQDGTAIWVNNGYAVRAVSGCQIDDRYYYQEADHSGWYDFTYEPDEPVTKKYLINAEGADVTVEVVKVPAAHWVHVDFSADTRDAKLMVNILSSKGRMLMYDSDPWILLTDDEPLMLQMPLGYKLEAYTGLRIVDQGPQYTDYYSRYPYDSNYQGYLLERTGGAISVTVKPNPGDIDGDGEITTGDVRDLFTALCSSNGFGGDPVLADMNGDTRVDLKDVTALYKKVKGL